MAEAASAGTWRSLGGNANVTVFQIKLSVLVFAEIFNHRPESIFISRN